MLELELLTASGALGLLGSLHCTGMCGPLITAGCSGQRGLDKNHVSYLVGRNFTYAFLGAGAGALGGHAVHRWQQTGLPHLLLATVATLAGLRGLWLIFGRARRKDLVALPRRAESGWRATWKLILKRLPRRGLGLGLVTGLFPCGLLWAAAALAAGTSHPVRGALVMTVFGIASMPGLLLPLLIGRWRRIQPLLRSPRAQGALWCAFALYMAARPVVHHLMGGGHHHHG